MTGLIMIVFFTTVGAGLGAALAEGKRSKGAKTGATFGFWLGVLGAFTENLGIT